MSIQWYPGHMHKTGKAIKQILPQIDLIIEILDARIPFSSQNPMLSAITGNKPSIKMLNKADLADPKTTRLWQTFLEQNHNIKTLLSTTKQAKKIHQIIPLCHQMIPKKGSNDKIIKTIIIGIPNAGKSTIINILAERILAKTGNEPAVTKRKQRIKLKNNIIVYDTPGMLWANIENPNSGYRLAITGAIKDTAIEYTDIAFFVAEYLLEFYPEYLKNRFRLTSVPKNALNLIEIIGRKRGCLQSGKQVDFDKIAKILIYELRSGLIGRISLETPDMIEKELSKRVL